MRAVEYGEVTRIGANKAIQVDVRIVAATNEHLPGLVEKGRFRADLLDRLAFEVVTLPPLRAREGDVPVLADHFGRRMASEIGWREWPGFSAEASAVLATYDWPGNVRELKNVIERAVYRWTDEMRPIETIEFDPFASPWRPSATSPSPSGEGLGVGPVQPSHHERLGPTFPTPTPPLKGRGLEAVTDFRASVDAHERSILEATLTRCRYNQREAAKALALTYDQLRHCLRKHGMLEKKVA